MAGLRETFDKKEKTFSFEVFPANTPEGHAKLLGVLGELCALNPDFVSCTYGAGGGNRARTLETACHIQDRHGIEAVAHLTCISHSRTEIETILEEFTRRGIKNVLALRGDPPKEGGSVKGDFAYSSDLVEFMRKRFGQEITIGVAGFPEKHALSKTAEEDAYFLQRKIRAGADFVITQLFFENRVYFDYVKRLRGIGVQCRAIPGILPIVDYEALKRFCARCGATVSQEIHDIFGAISGDAQKVKEAGIRFAIKQCRELLEGGAPGIHFYTLNKIDSSKRILEALRE